MNKKQALDIAKTQLSQVFRVTPGTRGWGFRFWSKNQKGWGTIGGYTYTAAREVRAEQIAARAYLLLGGDYFDALRDVGAGSSAARLAQMMARYPIKNEG